MDNGCTERTEWKALDNRDIQNSGSGGWLRRKESSCHPCPSSHRNVVLWSLYCFHSEISHVLDHVSDFVASLSFSRYFFSFFSALSRSPFPGFPFFSTLVSFAIGEDSECQQCSTKVDARCVCYWIPSRIPFSRRAAVSRNKLIEILLPLWNILATSFI